MYSSPCQSRQNSRPATPQNASFPAIQTSAPGGPSTRWMQVKVLYTFDDDSKTNCLARCPQPLQIQTAHLDNATQVGIIELKTCIRAIVSASPELLAKLERDFTVYAYDYSEYETPLVGQGMLSRVLASSSANPTAPALQSETMVTGRVTRNGMGLFSSGGIQETLEVKLRLVPVPTSLQSEYVEGLEKYRDPASFATDKLDAAAWAAFLQGTPDFGGTPPAGSDAISVNYDARSMTHPSPDDLPTPQDGQTPQPYGQFPGALNSAPHYGSDAGSPFSQHFPSATQSQSLHGPPSRSHTPIEQRRSSLQPQSRPSSRASHHGRPQPRPSHASLTRVESAPPSTTIQKDEGPARKRARIEQVDWSRGSSFGQKPDSLRVAASTAASIRGQRLSTIAHPTASQIAAGELPDRPPTPRAMPRFRSASLARRASETASTRPRFYRSPYSSLPDSDADLSVAGSPAKQDFSTESSPQDIPSSPPVARKSTTVASSPPFMPCDNTDSGFFSGTLNEDFGLDDEPQLLDDRENKTTCHNGHRHQRPPILTSELSFNEEIPGDPSLLPTSSRQQPSKAIMKPKKRSSKSATPLPSSPSLPPLPPPSDVPDIPLHLQTDLHTDSHEIHDLEAVNQYLNFESNNDAQQDQWQSKREPSDGMRGRSQSFVGDYGSRAGSPAADLGLPANLTRKNSSLQNEKKKRAIQERLETAVKNGRMPTFCENCGEISTPTWRKAFVRVERGSPDHLEITEDDGAITAIEVLTTDDSGQATSYKIIKKSLRSDENKEELGYTEINLCNSCGMWLIKRKEMRPPDMNKVAVPQPRRRNWKAEYAKRKARREAKKDNLSSMPAMPESEGNNGEQSYSQPPSGRSDKSIAKSSGRSDRSNPKSSQGQRCHSSGNGQSRQTTHLSDNAAAAALQKAIFSSPPSFPGSKYSPINLEDDGKERDSVKRLLFPSPRRSHEKASPTNSKPDSPEKFTDMNFDAYVSQTLDKENFAPTSNENMFAGFDDSIFTSPTGCRRSARSTNSPYRSRDKVLKTPQRNALTPRGGITSAARRWLEELDGGVRRSPLTPTRSSGGRSSGRRSAASDLTPFTKQLRQMIDDAAGPSPGRMLMTGAMESELFGSDGLDLGAQFQWDGNMESLFSDGDGGDSLLTVDDFLKGVDAGKASAL